MSFLPQRGSSHDSHQGTMIQPMSFLPSDLVALVLKLCWHTLCTLLAATSNYPRDIDVRGGELSHKITHGRLDLVYPPNCGACLHGTSLWRPIHSRNVASFKFALGRPSSVHQHYLVPLHLKHVTNST